MENAHPLSTPMVVRSLDVKKDPFRPQEDDEEILRVGTVLHQLESIGMGSNMFYVIFVEQLT
jgi:hypothetical protein